MEKHGRLLITGAAGTIGSVLSKTLADSFDVVRLDRKPVEGDSSVHSVDLTDIEALRKVMREARVTHVAHLAGNPYPEAPWEEILRDNIIATHNVFACAQELGVKKVVFASTTHLYGSYEGYPQTSPLGRSILPSDPPRSNSDYGDSKGYGEILARRYYDQHGLQVISIRIGHVTPDNKPEAPYQSVWLSNRDVTQVFSQALLSEVPSGEYFAMSDNEGCMFDITPTKIDLNYTPEDSAQKAE